METQPLWYARHVAADPRRVLRHELQRFFEHRDVTAWIGCDVMIVQGDVALHADVAVAIGADPRTRRAWVSAVEGRSIDAVFRFVSGGARLPALTSAARHVELGAREAFVFHPRDAALWGFRGDAHGAAQVVDAIPVGAGGALRSRALGAELVPAPGRLRLVRATDELAAVIERLERALDRVHVA